MAVRVTESISVHDLAVEASARAYQLQGYEANTRTRPDPKRSAQAAFDVVIPELRRVEEIETAETLAALDLKRLERCRRQGFQVWVLVPMEALPAAHVRLQGTVDHIVPFWLVDEERVRFGPPRLP
jgi:hypothetical protein